MMVPVMTMENPTHTTEQIVSLMMVQLKMRGRTLVRSIPRTMILTSNQKKRILPD